MITVSPKQIITVSDSVEFASLQSYLDNKGYTIGGQSAVRTDDLANLKITIEYPSWELGV